MQFANTLIEGVLLKRYKRFLADVQLPGGRIVTAHTPNTGSMMGCSDSGSNVWLSDSQNPKRKYPLTWELVRTADGVLVGLNTSLTNGLVREAIEAERIPELRGYKNIRREVRYGVENSRIDLLLDNDTDSRCYVEVKNVTLVQDRIALFPDAVSARGTRHLRELAHVAATGQRAVIFYCVQREDAGELRPADAIDPEYGRTLRWALNRGVEALAYDAAVSTSGVELRKAISVVLVDPNV